MTAPVAAKGGFPYPHRTVAEIEGETRSEPGFALLTCRTCGHRTATACGFARCWMRGVAA